MAATSELAVLMALRVHGRSDAALVARAAGCDMAAAAAALAASAAQGTADLVSEAAPAPATFAIAAAGRARLADLVAAEPIDRAALAGCYDDRFAAADQALKEAVTAWQLAAAAAKPAAQAAVLASAAGAGDVAAALAAIAPRLAPYRRRLAAAATAIAGGDPRFIASPRVDSLHQIWFELHEDLLVTLGRSRDA